MVVRKNEMKIRDWMFNHIPAPGFMPGAFYFLLGFAGSVLLSVSLMCSGLLLDFLGGLLGFFGELLLDIDGVAGDVFAALAEEEPDKHEDRTTEDKEAVFDRIGPVSGKEDYSINDAKADSIEVATGENDFLGEREITSGEGIFGAIVGVAEELAVEDELEDTAN